MEIQRDGSRAESVPDPGAELRAAAAETLAAMRAGADVVYQATFFDGRWRGHADFLRRVEEPSDLGPWSYEVWDTKLARHVKGSAVLQLWSYSDMLAAVQGCTPEWMTVALGGSAHAKERLRVSDYAAYARLVRQMFEAFVARDVAYPPATRPDPVEHCDVCRWSADCAKARRRADDLSLVAGITGRQRRGLREHAVDTRRSLAGLELPLLWTIPGTGTEALVTGAGPGAHPGAGRARRPRALRAACPASGPRRRARAQSRTALAPGAVSGRPVLRHRG